jgi:uncharacterized cupin superfamily protein
MRSDILGALGALSVAAEAGTTAYPSPYREKLAGRKKRRLAAAYGLDKYGVNLTELAPGASSSELHWHTRLDEFIYVLKGNPTLFYGDTEEVLEPGQCIGFPSGAEIGHTLVNCTEQPVHVLEIGDRAPGDVCHYPRAAFGPVKLYPDNK